MSTNVAHENNWDEELAWKQSLKPEVVHPQQVQDSKKDSRVLSAFGPVSNWLSSQKLPSPQRSTPSWTSPRVLSPLLLSFYLVLNDATYCPKINQHTYLGAII